MRGVFLEGEEGMKQYVLSQEDVDRLLAYVDRDPRHGPDGKWPDEVTK